MTIKSKSVKEKSNSYRKIEECKRGRLRNIWFWENKEREKERFRGKKSKQCQIRIEYKILVTKHINFIISFQPNMKSKNKM